MSDDEILERAEEIQRGREQPRRFLLVAEFGGKVVASADLTGTAQAQRHLCDIFALGSFGHGLNLKFQDAPTPDGPGLRVFDPDAG